MLKKNDHKTNEWNHYERKKIFYSHKMIMNKPRRDALCVEIALQ